MERFFTYFLALLLLPAAGLFAQRSAATAPATLPDSVKAGLDKTRNPEAMRMGTDFSAAWNAFSAEQQRIIRSHLWQMRRKKISARPTVVNYLGAVLAGSNDAQKLRTFLTVTDQALANETPSVLNTFFSISRTLLERQALHYERAYRLYASNADFTFDYAAPTELFDINDTPADNGYDNPPADTSTDIDEPYASDTAYQVAPPLWMGPPPQPLAEGPVIRFNRVTLTLVTAYDSVSLRDTKGAVSARSGLFIGEEGSFDWTSGGLDRSVVNCDLVAYNFNIRKPEIKADLAKLSYAGKTPGVIAGTFEFKSMARRDSALSTYPRFRSFQNDLAIQGIADDRVTYKGGFSLFGNKVLSSNVNNDPSTIQIFHDGQLKMTARSAGFQFGDSSITSAITRVNIPVGQDSITHPAVRMGYYYDKDSVQRIILQKDKGHMKHTPYTSNFFNIDLATDVIRWDLFSDSLDLRCVNRILTTRRSP